MNDQTYNGWKNYETWAVGMFLDGNYTGEGTYREVLELADDDMNVYMLASILRTYVADTMPDMGTSLASDLLSAALDEVDWDTLAEHKLSELAES